MSSNIVIPIGVNWCPVTHEPAQDERYSQILDATEALISQMGYERVRLVDVSDAAGISIGALQHRFRSRENLLRATVSRANDRERDRWIDLTREVEEPWQRLLALISNILTIEPERAIDSLWIQVVAASRRHPDLARAMQTQQDRWVSAFRQVLEDGIASGRMSTELSPEEAGRALLALIDGFYLARNIGDQPPTLDTIRHIVDVVVRRVIDVHELPE